MFNKIPLFRILVLFTLLCVTLTACTATPVLSPTATMKIETPTPSVTATATEAPPSPTATETPVDPNMPEGATGKDARGNYIKETAEGTFTWTVLEDQTGKEVVKLWTKSHFVDSPANLRGGIPMVETDDAPSQKNDHDPLYINFQEGIIAPYFRHDNHVFSDPLSVEAFTSYYSILTRNAAGLSRPDTIKARANDTLSIDFTDETGKTYTWITGQGAQFIGVTKGFITKENFPDLTISTAEDFFNQKSVSTYVVFTTPSHGLVILSEIDNSEILTPKGWMVKIIGPFGPVSSHKIGQKTGFLATQRLVNNAIRPESPQFVIEQK